MKISKNTVIRDIVNSDIYILNSAELTIYGTVKGNIYLSPSTKCIIHGMFNGSIFNNGEVIIFGTVKIESHIGNKILIKQNAIINNIRYLNDELI